MDLTTFRDIADRTPSIIAAIRDDPRQLCAYAGLDFEAGYSLQAIEDALKQRIRAAFDAGHMAVSTLCRSLQTDLVREHVIFDAPLDPYHDLLDRLRYGAQAGDSAGEIRGNWDAAIQAARDSAEMTNNATSTGRPILAREYNVALSAKALKLAGYAIRLEPGIIAVEETSEASLVAEIERLVSAIGGINVAREIFRQITPSYDPTMGRYHIVPSMNLMGGGDRQAPFGYLLQLAVKHLDAGEPTATHAAHWQRLIGLATDYAAVIDVQPYYPAIFSMMDAGAMLKYLQEQALYDSVFRFLQLRASDVLKICQGALAFIEISAPQAGGWTLGQAFEVIAYLMHPWRDVRGPVVVDEREIRRQLNHIPRSAITVILRDVLSHDDEGPNCKFSRPTDAPTPEDKTSGANFYLKPLIRRPGNRYLILDRSMCGWGYVEALLTTLRSSDPDLDAKVGMAMERFVEAEFLAHGVDVLSGDYDFEGHGECDAAVLTPDVLVFLELKKKTLTRRARAGSDADLLLDLAGSLLDALAQAGWHEARITKAGFLDLVRDGATRRLSLDGRGIEKIALGMLDFGSFQDRTVLKQFMEAAIRVNFNSSHRDYAKRLTKMNAALDEIRQQCNIATAGKTEVRLPFFNCWFMSIPQLLILLDEVSDPASFRKVLWSYRHMATGTSDLYFEISHWRHVAAGAAKEQSQA